MNFVPNPHYSWKQPFLKSIRETLNATSHAAGAISCNEHKNISPPLEDTVKKLCIYVEHSFTSVPIKHRNIDKVKIEDISFPTETD